jgi:UDP-glucose 4-epimerase
MVSMSNVLVTGGAGYIGSICCARLLECGHSVYVVDDLSTGFRGAVPDGVTFYKANILDQRAVREILRESSPDVVFHFAAKSLVSESMSNPGLYFSENMGSGILFLEELRHANVRKFVFSSSAAVYGNAGNLLIVEDHAKHPVNPYGETKLMFERILAWYAQVYGWGVAVLRYFNACGAWGKLGERHDPETHVVPLLLQAAAGEAEACNIFGDDYPTPDGTCLRDYVHVLDIADAHILTMASLDAPEAQAYNIGTGNSHSVKDLVRVAERITGKRIPVRVSHRRPGDPAVLCASPEKLMRAFGWKPKCSDLMNIVQSAWEFQLNAKKQLAR